jgi:hypothetical protein
MSKTEKPTAKQPEPTRPPPSVLAEMRAMNAAAIGEVRAMMEAVIEAAHPPERRLRFGFCGTCEFAIPDDEKRFYCHLNPPPHPRVTPGNGCAQHQPKEQPKEPVK